MALAQNDEELFERGRRELSTGLICDSMTKLGIALATLPPRIRPLATDTIMIGRAMPALEAMAKPDGSHMVGAKPFGLLFKSLDTLKHHEVYVLAGGSDGHARLGDLTLLRAAKLSAAGVVINGYVRDTRGVLEMKIPTFSCGSYALAEGPRRNVIDFRCDVKIGGVRIRPGDLVFGDADGVCVIPKDVENDVLDEAFRKSHLEKEVRAALESGVSIAEVFENFGII